MGKLFDIIIIGSGPAGVSSAIPLVNAGHSVLMVDGGETQTNTPPKLNYLEWRQNEGERFQKNRIIGANLFSLKKNSYASPKMRVPIFEFAFNNFLKFNKIANTNFSITGSLAKGGLSNVWGCGVAALNEDELKKFPFPQSEMRSSYDSIIKRIGISGSIKDDLSDYFGVDRWAQPPIEVDNLHHHLIEKYNQTPKSNNFLIGRPRLAILSSDHGQRFGCKLCGNCLWGCAEKSTYSSNDDLNHLLMHENFQYISGFQVEGIQNHFDKWSAYGVINVNKIEKSFFAKKIIMASGTVATTRIIMRALNFAGPVNLLSCPTAAFMLWVPKFSTVKPEDNFFGSAQLSFMTKLNKNINACGATFLPTPIPVSEFVTHLPIPSRISIPLLGKILKSCIIGNAFISPELQLNKLSLTSNDEIKIESTYREDYAECIQQLRNSLKLNFSKLGATMLPGSFIPGKPGADIHYCGTLPMKENPGLGETNWLGEVFGLQNVYVVDGASLPILTEKPHTLTIMANADRISNHLVKMMK